MPEDSPSSHVDPTGKGWAGFDNEDGPTEPNGAPRPTSAGKGVEAKPGYVVGEVRGLQSRSETELERPRIVWTFRLERYDAAGNRLRPVSVEIKGFEFHGSINEGDLVEVKGDQTSGTISVSELYNHTTGSQVTADDKTPNLLGCLVVVAVIAVIFVLIAIYLNNQFEQEIRQRRQSGELPSAVERWIQTGSSTHEDRHALVSLAVDRQSIGGASPASLRGWDG